MLSAIAHADATGARTATFRGASARRVAPGRGEALVVHEESGEVFVGLRRIASLGAGAPSARMLVAAAGDGRGWSRTELFEYVWVGARYRPPSSDNNVRVTLARLRAALGEWAAVEHTPRGGLALVTDRAIWLVSQLSSRSGDPASNASLIGRDRLLAEACAALRVPGGKVVFTGPIGVGKTALALAVLRELDGSAVVVRRADQAAAGASAFGAALVALGVAVPPRAHARELAGVLRQRLGGEPLLMFDSVHEDFFDTLGDLAVLAPRARCLVTTRQSGGLEGWERVAVPTLGLAGARDVYAGALNRLGAPLGAANSEGVDTLLACLGGLPLAIELAARRALAIGPEALADLISRDLAVLGAPPGAPENSPLHVILAEATASLNPEDRDTLVDLSVFVDGWSHDAALAVTRRSAGELLECAARLVDAGMVEPHPVGPGRLRLLPLVRTAAVQNTGKNAERRRQAAPRLVRWLHAELVTRLGPSKRASTPAQIRWLADERLNLLSMLDWAIENEPEAAAGLAHAVYLVAVTSGGVGELPARLDGAREAERRAGDDPERLTLLLRARGHARRLAGDLNGAVDDARAAMALNASPAAVARAAGMFAQALADMGESDGAQQAYVQAEELSRVAGAEDLVARAVEGQALLQMARGESQAAIGQFERANAMFMRQRDSLSVARTHCNLSQIALRQREFASAQNHARAAIRASTSLGDQFIEGEAQANLARALQAMGDSSADAVWHRAEELAKLTGNAMLLQTIAAERL